MICSDRLPKLVVKPENIYIEDRDNILINLADEQGYIIQERYPWIDRFLGVNRTNHGYEVLFYHGRDILAKWTIDSDGYKKGYQNLKQYSIAELVEEFNINYQSLSPQINHKIKQDRKAKTYYEKAKKYSNLGKHNKAEHWYYRALLVGYENYQYLCELGNCLAIQGKFLKALEIYLLAAAKESDRELNIWHLKHRLLSYIKNKNDIFILNKAIDTVEKMAAIMRRRSSVLDLLGELYLYKNARIRSLSLKVLASSERFSRLEDIKLDKKDDFICDKSQLKLPDFMVIGAQKSGTTALFQYISDHPDIYPALVKEIFFFDNKYDYSLDWYKSHFPILPNANYLTGEGSATYFNSIEAARRIAKVIPNIKLVFIIRNPVKRAISDYHMKVRDGQEKRNLEEAISSEINCLLEDNFNILNPGKQFFQKHKGYVRNGLYYYFLKEYLQLFPAKNTMIIKGEDLRTNTREIMQKVFNFMEVEDYQGDYPVVNVGKYSQKENNDIDRKLATFYEKHNLLLENLLKTKLNWD